MVKAARSDMLVERVDQLADVYGEVLLGLYDELTDQRERTEAVAARADGVLSEARRLMDDMSTVAAEARVIERQASAAAAAVPGATAEAAAGATVADPAADTRTREALSRLADLEAAAAALEQSVQQRTDAAVARSESLTNGLGTELRAHVQQSVTDMRTEVQSTVTELRQHVRDLVEAVTREAQEAAQRAEAAAASAARAGRAAPSSGTPTIEPTDTATIVEEVRRQASSTIADQVRRQAADSVAEELQRQRQSTPLAPAAALAGLDDDASVQVVAQLRQEIEDRTSNFAAAAERAQELSARLDDAVNDVKSQLQDATTDRAAAAFALRESRAELDAAKRTLDLSDFTFTLDRLRRTEMFLYATAMIAVVSIALALWALLK
ncbi:MAG: hypothetical protein QOI55_1752 [Actinomycetota bacterium]|nr:hypothetical protein [Actinomycetota bacterium]